MSKLMKHATDFLVDVLETVIISISVFIVSFLFIFQLHEVNGQSMDGIAEFHDGQRLITDKVTYRFREPTRQEVIVFKFPQRRTDEFIKRIIGLPGETIQVKDGHVFIYNSDHPNGYRLDESKYLDDSVYTSAREFLKEGEKVEIPKNKYIVMGDNRPESYDSRSWGFVDRSDIVGRSLFRYWPPNEISFVEHH